MGQIICQKGSEPNPQNWRQTITLEKQIEDDDVSNFQIGDLSPQNFETYFSRNAKELLIRDKLQLNRMLFVKNSTPTPLHLAYKSNSQERIRQNRSLSNYKEQELRGLKRTCKKIADMQEQYCLRQPFKNKSLHKKNNSLDIKMYQMHIGRRLLSPQKQKPKTKRRFKRFNHLQ